MCGINGITSQDEALVTKMNAATVHRGPDGSRVWSDGAVTLGFNRLAIIDLSIRAMQPMQSADGRYTIVFNGEIYNYKELKKELSMYPFSTESDTEVILAAYSLWGDDAFQKLNGMFALALWDSVLKRLVLVRDPVGIKPLYYTLHNGQLIFSSEIRGVLASGVPRTIDQSALSHYLRLMYAPGDMTLFSAIKKVPVGGMLVHTMTGTSLVSFPGAWPREAAPQTYVDAVAATTRRVARAVERQLVSDRSVGVYLSGGIDSSVILASAVASHPKVDTFSVGFDLSEGEEVDKFNQDVQLAVRTAAHFGSTHHEFRLSSAQVGGLFQEMIQSMDAPLGNATTLAQLFLSRQAKDTATVVLTGDGGDELFGGYERYALSRRAARAAPFVPSALTQFLPKRLQSLHLTGVDRYAQLMFQKGDSFLQPLTGLPVSETKKLFIPFFQTGQSIATELMYADECNWLRDEALLRSDIFGMAASIEIRVPLIDLEVRSLAHAIPEEWKVSGSITKRVLKDAFRTVLPPEVLAQPKRGWFSPGSKWLRRPEFVSIANEVFSDGYTDASRLFNLDAVRARLADHRAKRGYYYTELWATLVFLSWAREYKATL